MLKELRKFVDTLFEIEVLTNPPYEEACHDCGDHYEKPKGSSPETYKVGVRWQVYGEPLVSWQNSS
jgi:hypothetical protein